MTTPSALAERFAAANAHEQRHRERERAKFKACEQFMPYEQFKEMVDGAHLRPVNLRATPLDELSKRTLSHEFAVGGDDGGGDVGAAGIGAVAAQRREQQASEARTKELLARPAAASSRAPAAAPAHPHEFERDWRRLCPTEDLRFAYLAQMSGANVAALFAQQLEPSLLGEMLRALGAGVDADASCVERAFDICAGLSAARGFAMGVSFLSDEEMGATKALLDAFAAVAPTEAPAVAAAAAEGDAGVTAALAAMEAPSAAAAAAKPTKPKQQRQPAELPGWGVVRKKTGARADAGAAAAAVKRKKREAAKRRTAPPPPESWRLPFDQAGVERLRSLYTG